MNNKKISFRLPDDVYESIMQEAESSNIAFSKIIRRRLSLNTINGSPVSNASNLIDEFATKLSVEMAEMELGEECYERKGDQLVTTTIADDTISYNYNNIYDQVVTLLSNIFNTNP